MKKSQALYNFLKGFGIEAYPATAVPETAKMPYLTFTKGFSRDGYSATVHLYYHTESESVPDAKAEEICDALRNGGRQVPCDDGQLWITLEDPEWYASPDDTDLSMKHRIINISINDFTL